MKKTEVVAEYDYYTLDQARKILYPEFVAKRQMKIKIRRKKLIKQKCIGLVMSLCSIIAILCGDGAFILFFILGLCVIFTGKILIY